MRTPIRRSVRFTLHFEPAPIPLPLNCLSEYAEPIEQVELLCDGKLLHRYSRSFGSATREYLCDTDAHRFTLRTCGPIQLQSHVELPAGRDSCYLNADENDAFRLTFAETRSAPPDIDIMKYSTTYAVAEDLVGALLDWTNVLADHDCLLISFDEDRFGIYYQTDDTLHCGDSRASYCIPYDTLQTEHSEFRCYDRLSVENRMQLQRYVFGYLHTHEELESFRFDLRDTYIRVTAAPSLPPKFTMLCHEIYQGLIARALENLSVRCGRLYPDENGFTVFYYDSLLPNAAPLQGKSLRYNYRKEDAHRFHSTEAFRNALLYALQQNTPEKANSNVLAEDGTDHILLTKIEDPYFTFD